MTSMEWHPDTIIMKNAAMKNIQENLSVESWFSDLEKEIGLKNCPLLQGWFQKKRQELFGENGLQVDDRERWRRNTALFGILHHSFHRLNIDLKSPSMGIDTYCLTDVIGPNEYFLDFGRWDQGFESYKETAAYDPEKGKRRRLRQDLLTDFINLWKKTLDDLLKPAPDKDPIGAIKLQKARREFVDENTYYESIYLINALYKLVPPLVAEKKQKDLDHGARYLLAALEKFHVNGERRLRKLRKILLDGYWDRLKDLAKNTEAKTIVDLLREEVPAMYDRG